MQNRVHVHTTINGEATEFLCEPRQSLLECLRDILNLTGTKEGCNEGDCGACTVVIGEAAAPGDASAVRGLTLQTVNACIQFLPTLDGKALFTVEDLKAMTPKPASQAVQLHPVQQAMVDCHGSQCGFCTPGFVMSLWSTYEHSRACNKVPTRQQLADGQQSTADQDDPVGDDEYRGRVDGVKSIHSHWLSCRWARA